MSDPKTPAVTPVNPVTGFAAGLSAFEAKLLAFYNAAKEKLMEVADAILPELEAGAAAVENAVEIALEDLAGIAGQAVLTQAAAVASGTEKFGNAVNDVVMTVEAQGKTVAQATAQMAVQTAYKTAQEVVATIQGQTTGGATATQAGT